MTSRKYCTRPADVCGDKYCAEGINPDGCPFLYDESRYEEDHKYHGDKWPPPKRWLSKDGVTVVYRSYADFIDD